jgi:transposase
MSKLSQSPKRRKSHQRKELPQDIPKVDVLKQININAAGLDIGDDEIYAAVPEGRDKESVRVFGTFTVNLNSLADWLEACEVTTVAMESTGIYWISIYEILEARGFQVYLVNAKHIKNVTGKKTDILDCQWIQQLHTYGLLRASFRPPDDIAALRSLVRHRANLIRSVSAEIQHMQKALQLMNLKLTNVVSDITGLTGMCIIRDIISGVHDPETLAKHRDSRCAKGRDEIALSLQGNYKAEHLFELKQSLEAYDFYQGQIRRCDEQIEGIYNAFQPQVNINERPLPSSRKKRRKPKDNEPDFDLRSYLYQIAGVDLTEIDGVNSLTAQVVLSEIGTDMSKWATVKHFTSWLGLCPHNDKTGGKVIRTCTHKTQNRASAALRMAASALSHSHSALGGYYRRMRAKLGSPEAVTATAHKLARIIYAMLKDQTEYHDPGEGHYEEQARQRAIKNLKHKANQLGFRLIEVTAP